MLGELIIEENICVWICLIKFSISNANLIILDLVIEKFFITYCQLFPDANMKPKSHFLRHYPEMMKQFGPLVKTKK